MFAVIRKTLANKEWLMGFCGTPSEIVEQFLSSGVRDLYQTAWFSVWGGDLVDAKKAIDDLDMAANAGTVTRKDLEALNFSIINWKFSCGCVAETKAEAVAIAETLEALNADVEGVPQFRQDRLNNVLAVLKNDFPDVDEAAFEKALRGV